MQAKKEKNMSKKEQITVTGGKIDKEVLDVMKQEDVLKALEDSKQVERLKLNCFAEFLSELMSFRKDVAELLRLFTVLSADKLDSLFKEVHENLKEEVKRQEVQEKIHADHKKSKKNK